MGQAIIDQQPGFDVIEAVAKFVKMKTKDWKDSNMNIIKEAVALFSVISSNSEKVNNRHVSCIMPFLSDKLGDVKTSAAV